MARLARRWMLFLAGLMVGTLVFTGCTRGQTVSEQYLLAAINEVRAARHLPALQMESSLSRAARMRAEQMATRLGVEHRFSGEATTAGRAASAGASFSRMTENVGEAGSAVLLHDLWMHSSPHRANLLDPLVTVVGIGVVARAGKLYGVEDFADQVRRISFDEQEQSVGALLVNSGLRLVKMGPSARQTCALSTGYAGQPKPWFIMRYVSSDINRIPQQLEAKLRTGRYHEAAVGACVPPHGELSSYALAVLLYP